MDVAVFDYSLAAIDAEIDPFLEALGNVEGYAEAIGWDAGGQWAWWEVRYWLRDHPDSPEPFETWRDQIATVRQLGPHVSPAQLLATYRWWRDEYDDCVLWLTTADQLVHRPLDSAAGQEAARAYLAAAVRFWDSVWWWLGWLGKWISYRTRTAAP